MFQFIPKRFSILRTVREEFFVVVLFLSVPGHLYVKPAASWAALAAMVSTKAAGTSGHERDDKEFPLG